MKINAYIKLMRPKQWFKSLYIIFGAAPAVFLMPANLLLTAWLLFLGILNMILMQGVAYAINDAADVEKDKMHPTKRNRPIAAGLISKSEGILFSGLLLVTALLLAWLIDFRIVLIDLLLLASNLIYSLEPIKLKKRVYLDIFSISFNFPLRVMVGWYLFEPYNQAKFSFSFKMLSTYINSSSLQAMLFSATPRIIDLSIKFSTVTLSFISIMALTYFLSCFLASLKRLAEKLSLKNSESIRPVIKKYSVAKLKAVAISSALFVLVSAVFLAWSLKPILLFLVPFFAYCMHWYYRLTFLKNSLVKQPEEIFVKMPRFVLLVFLFIVLASLLLFI